jgi:predicted Zn finger-like uncharacterized protein
MLLVCPNCKNQINIDDASVPDGVFKVRCTSCGKIITSQRTAESAAPAPGGRPNNSDTSISPAVETFIRKEISTAKKEILDAIQSLFRGAGIGGEQEERSNARRALICSGDPTTSQRLTAAAKTLGYVTESTVTAADSLKNLDTFYSLVIVDPSFADDADAAKKLINRVNVRKAIERRQMFLVLVSPSQKTLDGNAAFLTGVNLIVNKADLTNVEASIRQSQKDFQQMYASFYEVSQP